MKIPIGLITAVFLLGILFVDSISDYSPDIQYFKDHNDAVLKSGFPFNVIIPLLLLICFGYNLFYSLKRNWYHIGSLLLLLAFAADFFLSSVPKLLAIQNTTNPTELLSIQQSFRMHHGMMILICIAMALLQIQYWNQKIKTK